MLPSCFSLRAPSAAAAARGFVQGSPLGEAVERAGHAPKEVVEWLAGHIGAVFGAEPEVPVVSLQVQAIKS